MNKSNITNGSETSLWPPSSVYSTIFKKAATILTAIPILTELFRLIFSATSIDIIQQPGSLRGWTDTESFWLIAWIKHCNHGISTVVLLCQGNTCETSPVETELIIFWGHDHLQNSGTWFASTPATMDGKERRLIHAFIQNTFWRVPIM